MKVYAKALFQQAEAVLVPRILIYDLEILEMAPVAKND